jgi:diketogulonate reductase-like aldo/keto reductase
MRMVIAGSAALASARLGKAWPEDRSSTPPMISREIPSSREVLPVIGLGTWQTFDIEAGSAEQRTLEEVLQTFVDLGGRLVDSSPMYGRSEAVVGEISATLDLRNRLFLATKVWTTGRQAGIRQMEESFQRLRARRIDLMQVHNLVDVATQLETSSRPCENGKRRVGFDIWG